MGANANNAIYFLANTLFELALWVWILRIVFQAVRADFYNPFSQMVWQLTQPVLRPIQGLLPKWRNFDLAAGGILLLLAVLYIEGIAWLLGYHVGWDSAFGFALLKIVVLTLNLYTFALFVQAILSWVGPGVSNPAGSLLWSMNEPLLRPVRRILPPLSGLDLSPLVVILLLQFLNQLVPLPGVFR